MWEMIFDWDDDTAGGERFANMALLVLKMRAVLRKWPSNLRTLLLCRPTGEVLVEWSREEAAAYMAKKTADAAAAEATVATPPTKDEPKPN